MTTSADAHRVPMLLFCPRCDRQHIDAPNVALARPAPPCEFPSHSCDACGYTWRPADVETIGVRALQTKGQGDRTAHPWFAKTRELPKRAGGAKAT